MSSFTRFLVFLGVLLLPLGNVAAQDDAYHSWLRSHLETEYGVTGGDWVLAGPTTVFEIDEETSGWVGVDADGNEVFSDDPRDLDDYSTTWIAEMAVDQSESAEVIPASYELQWSDPADSVNTSVSYPGGYVEMTLPVWCTNLDTGSACDLLVLDGDGDGAFDRSDELVITEREGFAPRRFRARVSFRKPILTDDVAPEAGARLRVSVAAPEGEAYQETFTLDHTVPSGVLVEQLDAEADRPFSRFARFTVSNPTPASPWQQAVRWPITAPVGGSDVLLAAIWLRGTSGSGMTPRLTVIFEMAGSPHTKSLNAPYTLADDWHLFLIPFELEAGYAPDEARFQLNLGFAEQTVDVGGLALLDYGNRYTVDELPFQVPSLGYDGQAPDAAWRADAEARIREHRMADLEIRVVDAAGNPVEGAAVEVEMQRHAFGFGSAVTAQMLAAGGSDNDRYRDIVDSYFNRVVFENDLKWKPWLAAQSNSHGSYRMTYLDEAIEWLRARDIEIRGHYLMWAPTGRWQPDQYLTDGSTLREATIEHIGEKLAWTEGRIDEWDAVNHIVANFGESTYDAMLGSNEIYLEVVRLGNELAPQAEIYVNEGNIIAGGGEADDYEAMIEWLISQDAPLDGIGFMGHFDGGDIVHPDMVYDRIDRFAAFDKLLQFTELDVDDWAGRPLYRGRRRRGGTPGRRRPDRRSIRGRLADRARGPDRHLPAARGRATLASGPSPRADRRGPERAERRPPGGGTGRRATG